MTKIDQVISFSVCINSALDTLVFSQSGNIKILLELKLKLWAFAVALVTPNPKRNNVSYLSSSVFVLQCFLMCADELEGILSTLWARSIHNIYGYNDVCIICILATLVVCILCILEYYAYYYYSRVPSSSINIIIMPCILHDMCRVVRARTLVV